MTVSRHASPPFTAKQNPAVYGWSIKLSRRMISLLQTVRDYGYPGAGRNTPDPQLREKLVAELNEMTGKVTIVPYGSGFISHQYLMFSKALPNRGLIIHQWPVKEGEPTLVLTRAGELVCELLVEAGLIPERAKQPKIKVKRKNER